MAKSKKIIEVAETVAKRINKVERTPNGSMVVGLEPKHIDTAVTVDRDVLEFLLIKYGMSLDGFETPSYRAARIAKDLSEMSSHQEINTYVELEAISTPIQTFLDLES